MNVEPGTYYAYTEYPREGKHLANYRNVICVEALDEPDDTRAEFGSGEWVPVRRVDGRSWVNETLGGGSASRDRLARLPQLVATWGEYTRAITESQIREHQQAEQAQRAKEQRRSRIEAAVSYFADLPTTSRGFRDLGDKIKRDLLRSESEGVTLTLDELLAIAKRFEEHEAIIAQNAILDYEPEPEEEADAAT